MQGLRRMTDATVGDQPIFKHLIVNFDIDEMRKQRAACQNMIEHLRSSVMHHGKAPSVGSVRSTGVNTLRAKCPDPVSSSLAQTSLSAVSWSSALKSPQTAIRASDSASNGSVPLYGRRQCFVADLFHNVVLADRGDAACLRALDAFILCDHEPDFVAGLKLVEVTVNHAVFVEIDLLAVRGLGKPVILKELSDLAVSWCGVGLHGSTHPPRMVFQLPTRRVKGIADGDIDILMGVVERSSMPHEHILPRHTEIDTHIIKLAVAMMTMGRFDDDSAAHDSIRKALELSGFLANSSLDRWRRLHAVKADLQGHLHLNPLHS